MSLKSKRKSQVIWTSTVFASFLLLSTIIFRTFAPVVKSSAEQKTTTYTSDSYEMSITHDPVVQINIIPSENQSIYTGTNELIFRNTCSAGASILLSSIDDTNSLIDNNSQTNAEIPATESTSLDNNSWGFYIDASNGYFAVPKISESPAVIYDTDTPQMENYSIPVTYGVKVNNSVPSGIYSANIMYSIIPKPDCLTYEVIWDFNGGEGNSEVLYPSQLGMTETADLSVLTPTRRGYLFIGWSNGSEIFTGEEVAALLNTHNLNPITMTAVWEEFNPVGIHAITNMQEMTPEVCEATTTPTNTATSLDWTSQHHGDDSFVPRTVLTDTRDGKEYLVSKLADGKCWMSQNLALDLSTNKTLTNTDTDLNSKISWTPDRNTQTQTGVDWAYTYGDTALSYHAEDSIAYVVNEGKTFSSAPTDNTKEYYYEKTGNYYNEFAATAGSTYPTYHNMAYVIAQDSICPKGWTLPKRYDSSNGDIKDLISAYSIYSSASYIVNGLKTPVNWIRTGMYKNGTIDTTTNTSSRLGAFWLAHKAYGQYSQTAFTFGESSWDYSTLAPNDTLSASIRCIYDTTDRVNVTINNQNGDSAFTAKVLKNEIFFRDEPYRPGYAFTGWFTQSSGGAKISNDYVDWYDGQTIYAQWEQINTQALAGITTMQQMTSSVCNSLTTPSATATNFDWNGSHRGNANYVPRLILTDTRDNNKYIVSKLADGSCWMNQNLALKLSTTKTLTSADTNLVTKSSWTPNNNTQLSNETAIQWDRAGADGARSYIPKNTHTIPGPLDNTNQEEALRPTSNSDQYFWEKIGIYYNWYSATAGSGTSTTKSASLSNLTNVSDSICPKGWMLPKGYANVDKSYAKLRAAYNITFTIDPLNFTEAGSLKAYLPNYGTTSNNVWIATSTADRNANSYYTFNGISADKTSLKGTGVVVRCVAL